MRTVTTSRPRAARSHTKLEARLPWCLLKRPIAGASPAVPHGEVGQAAVQTLTSTATGGTFRVQVDGNWTAPLTCTTTTGASLQSAIQAALGQYTPGTGGAPAISATGPASGPWVITIPANLVTQENANTALTIDNASATGGTVVAAVTTEGIPGGDELQGSGTQTSEPPRIVGASGQPAYAAGWSTPVGASVALTVPNAAAARADWEPLQFYEDADGFVHIEGVAQWAAAAAGLMFTLPTGYRPFQAHDDNNVEVRPDGTVTYMGSTTSLGAINVGDISFRPVGV